MKLNLFRAALFTPTEDGNWGLPLMAWGEPGVAKTGILRSLCDSEGLKLFVLSPGESGEGAFGVVPIPRDGKIYFDPPAWIDEVADGGCVFLDEINLASPPIQAAIMGILHGKRVGGATLGKRVRCVGAANPPDVSAAGYELSSPVANRLGHVVWEAPSVDEHANYMLAPEHSTGATRAAASRDKATAEEDRVMKHWPEEWARAIGLETGFLRTQSTWKNKCPKPGDPKGGRAWPSDRTWTMATRALASARVQNKLSTDPDRPRMTEADVEEFVASFVGDQAANAFFGWVARQDLPDPAAVLDGKVRFDHDSDRLDRTLAILTSGVALVLPKDAKRRNERAEALWTLMGEIAQDEAVQDVLVYPAHLLTKNILYKSKASGPVVRKLLPLLKAAGFDAQTAEAA